MRGQCGPKGSSGFGPQLNCPYNGPAIEVNPAPAFFCFYHLALVLNKNARRLHLFSQKPSLSALSSSAHVELHSQTPRSVVT